MVTGYILALKLDAIRQILMSIGFLGIIGSFMTLLGCELCYYEIPSKLCIQIFALSVSILFIGFIIPTTDQFTLFWLGQYVDDPDPIRKLLKVQELQQLLQNQIK